MFALHCPLFRAKLISIRLWELYQGNDFFDCLLSQFIFSSPSPSHPHSSFVFFFLLFCASFVYCLQWMATHGLKWLPCTPHWWSALHAPRLRWAQPWRRPWGPLKTLCSLPSPESRTESPDQAHSQLFVFYDEEILNVSSRPTCFTSARTRTPREPHLRWHEATHGEQRPEARSDHVDDPDLHTHHRMLLMWADNASLPPPFSYRLAALLC